MSACGRVASGPRWVANTPMRGTASVRGQEGEEGGIRVGSVLLVMT